MLKHGVVCLREQPTHAPIRDGSGKPPKKNHTYFAACADHAVRRFGGGKPFLIAISEMLKLEVLKHA
jgi:hypothetical protein